MRYDEQTGDVYLDVFNDAPERKLQPGETLIHAGDTARQVFNILNGCLMVSRVGKDGRRQVMSFLFKDNFVGLTATDKYFFTVQAITPATVVWRSRNQLEEYLAGDIKAEKTFRNMVFRVLENSLDLVYSLGQRTAIERLSGFLLYLRRQYKISNTSLENPNLVSLPMSRQDIADFLGLKKETVSRGFSELEKRQLISRPNSHSVLVLDVAALRSLAGIVDFSSPLRFAGPREAIEDLS
ncbi:MAG: Crp/Fnr family transcriptional regulator [Gammaproteobacteria bacterium]|jgi:CRP/FNR family transcriptional regulator, anaerobic regulatory protein|nr:Crp/Fnr family transcriptional regulator [Gammaproteobacteria bacterium]